jgi:hypothetical protein
MPDSHNNVERRLTNLFRHVYEKHLLIARRAVSTHNMGTVCKGGASPAMVHASVQQIGVAVGGRQGHRGDSSDFMVAIHALDDQSPVRSLCGAPPSVPLRYRCTPCSRDAVTPLQPRVGHIDRIPALVSSHHLPTPAVSTRNNAAVPQDGASPSASSDTTSPD